MVRRAGRTRGRHSAGTLRSRGSLLLFGLLAGCTALLTGEPEQDDPATFTCTVASITDGDTFRCTNGTRVRLSAVAARERDGKCAPGHPCPHASAAEATAALERTIAGQTLRCEQDGTSNNRITAWCRTPGGIEVNCAMIESGTAAYWERYDPQRRICRRTG